MSQPDPGPPGALPPQERRTTPWTLVAIGAVAMLVLLIGLVVWIGGGGDEITSTPIATTTSAAPTTVESTTSVAATTTSPTTTVGATTTVATTVPPTTVPPTTSVPAGPVGDTWTITSPYFPDDPFTLDRVARVDRISAYDGAIAPAPPGIRCVAIVIDGEDGWSEWCTEPDQSVNFVVLDGIDPWLVEVGAEPGDVALTRQEPTWSLPSNGCTTPMTTLIEALSPEPGVTTGVVCVPNEAFMSVGSVFLQAGPPDGYGALVTLGDEGWDNQDTGTSIGCEAGADGVDRCALYGVESELFEALLPIPPADLLTTATDITGMRDETATARGWIGAETEPPEIEGLISDELVDPDSEVPATVRSATNVGYGDGFTLLIIEVPALDDSILSTTWVAWISSGSPALVKMFAWETCARGLDVPSGLCI